MFSMASWKFVGISSSIPTIGKDMSRFVGRRALHVESTKVQSPKTLRIDNINPRVLKAEYAVRGEIVIRAEKYKKTLQEQKKTGKRILPFEDLVFCNIGNPQSLGQKPITFYRQLAAISQYPDLLKDSKIREMFPPDVIERAEKMFQTNPMGVGPYSHSQGIPFVRESIARFIEERDGYPCNPDDIFIHNGASPAVQDVLRLIIRDKEDGVMIPIPQYPLYSASISLLGGTQVPYYLGEEGGWKLSVEELQRALKEASNYGITTRALAIINPGNPTGNILEKENMKEVLAFCKENNILLMADEVYQENIYIKEKKEFHSFKKIMREMGPDYENFELASFHSISKGFSGECGQRAGYVEVTGWDPLAKDELYKLSSVLLCPNTAGQILLEAMVNPPKPGEPSYELYKTERDGILESLKRRATRLTSFLDSLEGVSCNASEGAMYAFPQISIPKKAVEEAQKIGKHPDAFYAISMLDETGVVVVPGSGFGQRDGTYHFRTTFLPSEEQIDLVMERMGKFHTEFLKKYS